MTTRIDKIKTLKGLLSGTTALNDLKASINVKRLSIEELRLIHAVLLATDIDTEEVAACVEYYRTVSNDRPVTVPEERGYWKQSDADDYPNLYPGSEADVKYWCQKLNLEIPNY